MKIINKAGLAVLLFVSSFTLAGNGNNNDRSTSNGTSFPTSEIFSSQSRGNSAAAPGRAVAAENASDKSGLTNSTDEVTVFNASGPGAPLPINDYEYALMAAGIAIAGYAALRSRRQNA